MNSLIIEETKYTPFIKLDCISGILEIKGKSYPENTFEFYEPVIDWIINYFKEKREEKIVLNLEIIYFNSSSSKMFFDLFDILEEASNNGFNVEINWHYDSSNESALESGEDFKEDFENLNFYLVEK